MSFATINLEAGFPTVDDARRRLVSEMQSAKARGVRVIKVIPRPDSPDWARLTPENRCAVFTRRQAEVPRSGRAAEDSRVEPPRRPLHTRMGFHIQFGGTFWHILIAPASPERHAHLALKKQIPN